MKNNEGKYIYAIIQASAPQEFATLGIGGRQDTVYTVHQNGLAAVVSSSPIMKYPVFRDNVMAHQHVLEEVMKRFSLLPVRFCTIGESEEDIREKVLKARYEEFQDLFGKMKDTIEVGVRAIWTNMGEIFSEIVTENTDIKQLKEEIAKEASPSKRRAGMMRVGEMVKEALEEKKEKEASELLAILRRFSVDVKVKEVYGDRNIAHVAFLVNKVHEGDFDEKIRELTEKYAPRKELTYIGPVPPYNFVEVIITW